jgi:predicted O-methyltransferase YrrM
MAVSFPGKSLLRQLFPRPATTPQSAAAPGDAGVKLFVPPGHFYSPVVDPAQIRAAAARVFDRTRAVRGIDLREAAQLAFVDAIARHTAGLDFPDERGPAHRYFYRNGAFSYGDANVFAAMLQEYRPRRLIEVGSGYSSALALDIVESRLGWATACTFIEPYPTLLNSLLSDADRARVTILPQPVQDVDLTVFDALEAGDMLFIDTTHVVKTGSDVLHHFENVLPRLRPGVVIHVHDIFHPFEYPEPWVLDLNLSWNELYYVRAFLADNPHYEILFFNNFMATHHAEAMARACPPFMRDSGSSFWMRKR